MWFIDMIKDFFTGSSSKTDENGIKEIEWIDELEKDLDDVVLDEDSENDKNEEDDKIV